MHTYTHYTSLYLSVHTHTHTHTHTHMHTHLLTSCSLVYDQALSACKHTQASGSDKCSRCTDNLSHTQVTMLQILLQTPSATHTGTLYTTLLYTPSGTAICPPFMLIIHSQALTHMLSPHSETQLVIPASCSPRHTHSSTWIPVVTHLDTVTTKAHSLHSLCLSLIHVHPVYRQARAHTLHTPIPD